jgi:hypothetical protein
MAVGAAGYEGSTRDNQCSLKVSGQNKPCPRVKWRTDIRYRKNLKLETLGQKAHERILNELLSQAIRNDKPILTPTGRLAFLVPS